MERRAPQQGQPATGRQLGTKRREGATGGPVFIGAAPSGTAFDAMVARETASAPPAPSRPPPRPRPSPPRARRPTPAAPRPARRYRRHAARPAGRAAAAPIPNKLPSTPAEAGLPEVEGGGGIAAVPAGPTEARWRVTPIGVDAFLADSVSHEDGKLHAQGAGWNRILTPGLPTLQGRIGLGSCSACRRPRPGTEHTLEVGLQGPDGAAVPLGVVAGDGDSPIQSVTGTFSVDTDGEVEEELAAGGDQRRRPPARAGGHPPLRDRRRRRDRARAAVRRRGARGAAQRSASSTPSRSPAGPRAPTPHRPRR